MALFGAGYSGYRRPLDTVIVVPPDSGLPTDVAAYQDIAGAGLEVIDVTTDEAAAQQRLEDQQVDVVLVAPDNVEQQFQAGKQSTIQVRVNVTDPVDQNYTMFLARALEREVNRIIVEKVAEKGQTYALSKGAAEAAEIPPEVVAAPTKAEVDNIAPAQPTVVQFFGTAVLALDPPAHGGDADRAVGRARADSGLFELFRISPITTAELVAGKLVAFGLLRARSRVITFALLVVGLCTCRSSAIPGCSPAWSRCSCWRRSGLGLLIAAVSDSERQAVQLSLLLLLASVFFSGFVLGTTSSASRSGR